MKVKVLRTKENYVDYYERYESKSVFYPVSTDWEEVTEEERAELQKSLYKANKMCKDGYFYMLVDYVEDSVGKVFKLASEWQKEEDRKEAKRQKKEEEEKEKRKERAKERKRKQYEKLKEEFDG